METADLSGYQYADASPSHSHSYLLPIVFRVRDRLSLPVGEKRLFELGCGNGSVAHELTRRGWGVIGVDPSAEGIAAANAAYPELKLRVGSAYDDLAATYGRLPVVLSLEVVEHVYFPRKYAATLFDLVQPGGLPSFQRLITATGRIWPWPSPARWIVTLPPFGITATSSSGP